MDIDQIKKGDEVKITLPSSQAGGANTRKTTNPPTSVETRTRRLEFEQETYWKSCCGKQIDKRAVMYFSQLFISLLLMGFSMWQLIIHHDDCNATQLYSGLLTLIIGVYMPSPKLNKK